MFKLYHDRQCLRYITTVSVLHYITTVSVLRLLISHLASLSFS